MYVAIDGRRRLRSCFIYVPVFAVSLLVRERDSEHRECECVVEEKVFPRLCAIV